MAEVEENILVITDLLLGAAHADGERSGEETQTVRDLLRELLDQKELSAEVEAHIEAFSPDGFVMKTSAATFVEAEASLKRKLLELVAAVRDADGELDVAEDDYLIALGRALKMDAAEFADLTLDYEIEELREHLGHLRSIPPPIPKA
jgi:uncharacterized tellurite resistance protein B-like protein